MPRSTRRLTLQTALTVQPQRLTQNQREYVVAPCIMIVEGVLNGGLVPGDEIRACHWDGIPLVINHPMADDGMPMSANAPDVPSVGRVYRTQYLTMQQQGQPLTRAQAELWLDVAQVQALGGDAVQAMQMIETQNPLEVSTAFYSSAETSRGTFLGVPYTEIHRDLIADHLALLPGGIGACSWADGCGCPRLNEKEQQVEPTEASRLRRVLAMFRLVPQADGVPILSVHQTDIDTREALYGALAREMGQDFTPYFIESLDMAAQTFTYRQGERLIQRSWTVQDGQIVLTADAQDVQRDTRYIPVTQERKEDPPMEPTAAVKARVTALIASPDTSWGESDRRVLEAMSEVQLAHLEPDPELVELRRAQRERKQTLINTLVENKCAVHEPTLVGLSVDELEGLAKLYAPQSAGDTSYAGQGLPAARQQDGGEESWQPLSILTKKE